MARPEHTTFADIEALVSLLTDFTHPWFIAGGWSIDLFLGKVTREHSDIEVSVLRRDQGRVFEYLRSWRLQKCAPGPPDVDHFIVLPWEGEWLELPVFQLRADSQDVMSPPEFDIFLNDIGDDQWLFRRCPAVTYAMARIGRRTASGIPYVAPEWQLLYKAKRAEDKDWHDFEAVVPLLDVGARSWLRQALERAHPGHEWIEKLR
jgi:hypothetical protein